MRKIIVFCFFSCFAILFSECSHNAKGQEKTEKKAYRLEYLKKVGEKKFTLDSLTSAYESIFFLRFQTLGGKKVITFLNQNTSTAYVYDYESSQLIKSINLIAQDRNVNKGNILNIYFKSLDSIFVMPDDGRNFYLVDSKNSPLKSYKKGNFKQMANLKSYETDDSVFVGPNACFQISDEYLYTTVRPSYWAKPYMGNQSVMARYHIETGKKENLNIHFPLRYQKEYFASDVPSMFVLWNFYTYNPKTKQFVHAFTIDENVYVADKDYKKVTPYRIKSECIDYIKPVTEQEIKESLKNHSFDYMHKRGMYYGILYDEYKDVYYREVRMPIQDKETAKKINFFQVPRTIIVFNNKFEKIGEYKLPVELEYDFTNAICTQEGLLIPRTVGDNEDILIFDIFNPLQK